MMQSETAPRRSCSVAYFSMEVGLDPGMPTYSGGLGLLAGDMLRAGADLGVPMVGVTLLHRKGYFRQHLDESGKQTETPAEWHPEEFLEALPVQAAVTVEGRKVSIRPWRYVVKGISGDLVDVYFLDTALPENSSWDQTLTDTLYGGDDHYRLCQEVVLGLGGAFMLRALGYKDLRIYHMNEGHSALLTLGLLEERHQDGQLRDVAAEDRQDIRRRCVFTTHTPVPAGMDKFPLDMVRRVLGEDATAALVAVGGLLDETLNMTYLALSLSHYINGVSMRHEGVSQDMFPKYPINAITNGVQAATWASPAFERLYNHHIPEWRKDNLSLRYAISIPLDEIHQAHVEAKQTMLAEVQRRTGKKLDPQRMTIGFARRATAYKRADLLFNDIERLKRIAHGVGPLQVIYGGKAHPRDGAGKDLIRRIFQAGVTLGDSVPVVYLEEYDMALAKYLVSGVDLWLNTPLKPDEASGTSGMKAAINGVPSFSILDGWWIEGHVEGFTGWSIGDSWRAESNAAEEIESLYDKLEYVIAPLFYDRPQAFSRVMRSCIALNGSFYNAQRMVFQYMKNAYTLSAGGQTVGAASGS